MLKIAALRINVVGESKLVSRIASVDDRDGRG